MEILLSSHARQINGYKIQSPEVRMMMMIAIMILDEFGVELAGGDFFALIRNGFVSEALDGIKLGGRFDRGQSNVASWLFIAILQLRICIMSFKWTPSASKHHPPLS